MIDQTASHSRTLIGQTVSHYRIVEKLGSGGMGVVYKAEDTRLDRVVAIKFLPEETASDHEALKRFHREARAASALNHPNICTVYDIGEHEGQPFMVMECMEGQTLKQLLDGGQGSASSSGTPRGTLPTNQVLELAIQIADALNAAHAKGIVHRDIKPANIFVIHQGQIKILDFGLAKVTTGRQQAGPGEDSRDLQTGSGVVAGTVQYMSPEQTLGQPLDGRSDLFSFGAVLYEMATGRRAFPGSTISETIAHILYSQPEGIGLLSSHVPPELKAIIRKCLEKEPEHRYQSAKDLSSDIQRLKYAMDASRVAAIVAKTSLRKRRGVVASAMVSAAIFVLGIAGWLWWQRSHPAAPEPPLTPVPLTSYPGFALQPAFSPDSNEVAFCWNEKRPGLPAPDCCADHGDHYDIYRKLIGGGEPLRLTMDPAGGEGPAWSPDGRFIAFYRYPQVCVMPALGGLERQVGKAGFWNWRLNYPHSTLAWTPDGRWLLLTDNQGTPNGALQGLIALSVDTGERRWLTSYLESQGGDEEPALSPDGRTLAFVRMQEQGIGDVYLLPLGENLQPRGEPQRLTYEDLLVQSPAWTRDGKEIFFSTGGYMSERSIRSVPAAPPRSRGEYRPRLETFGEDATTLAISPDGRRLAYSRVSQTINIYKVPLSGAAGPMRTPQIVAPSSRADIEPDFSPDGKRIAFASTRSGTEEIWVCDADGSNPRQMTSMGGSRTGNPKWSPDGNTILFESRREVMASLYVVSATGGAPRRLTKIPAFWASWSHDGKWIYFKTNGPIFRMPAAGGDPVQLVKGGEPAGSVDGKWVYFLNGGLRKVPSLGGKEIMVPHWGWHISFAVVEDGVYSISADWTEKATLLFYDFATGKTKVVIQMEKPAFRGIAISPDRRWVLVTQIVHAGSDLMLVENFR